MDYIRVNLGFEDRHYERKRADLNFRLDKVYDKIEESELTAKLMNGREKGQKEFTFAIMALDLNYLKKSTIL